MIVYRGILERKNMSDKKCTPCKANSVGGQAVIEGVMMKNITKVALAIRKEDGSIEIKNSEFHPAKEKHKWLNIPILRGIVMTENNLIITIKKVDKDTRAAVPIACTQKNYDSRIFQILICCYRL